MYRVAAAAAVVFAAGCASAAARAPVDVPAGRAPSLDDEVAREVGALLSGDGAAARDAEAALVALDGPGRAALARHAATIPRERDPRWLHVLDVHGLLPPLTPDEDVAFRLAEAARGEPGRLARARAALVAQARRDPAPLVARLRGGPGADLLALALGDAGATSAAPALLAMYRAPRTTAERRAAAAALGALLAPARGPDPDAVGIDAELEAVRVGPRVDAVATQGRAAPPSEEAPRGPR